MVRIFLDSPQVASGGVQQSTATLAQTKVLKEISSTLADRVSAVNEAAVRDLATRLFKNNQHLVSAHLSAFTPKESYEFVWNLTDETVYLQHDAFLAMVPAANAAADHLLPEPEHIDLTEEGEDGTETGAAGAAVANLDYELIDLSSEAATTEDDDLGGENCVCGCHSRTSKERVNQQQQHMVMSPHCLHCSIKFVNGRLYLRDGKNLRPAMAEVAKGGQTAEGDRVRSAKNTAKKGKKSAVSAAMEIVPS